jgi:predicted aldo/keto reductase-like oxidoreductase
MENNMEQKLEDIKKSIESLLKEACQDCGQRSSMTKELIIESLIWGSYNYYEAIGILEHSKFEYKELIEECFEEN